MSDQDALSVPCSICLVEPRRPCLRASDDPRPPHMCRVMRASEDSPEPGAVAHVMAHDLAAEMRADRLAKEIE